MDHEIEEKVREHVGDRLQFEASEFECELTQQLTLHVAGEQEQAGEPVVAEG